MNWLRLSVLGLFAILASGPATGQGVVSAHGPSLGALSKGASETQTVLLEPGANLVSLYVLPSNTSMEALLSEMGENLVSVRDGEGHVFAPNWDVRTLSTWSPGRSYLINVVDSVDFRVQGARLEAETEVVLEAGWNDVGFLYHRPVAADTALASIASSLNMIRDANDRVYPNAPGWRTLERLEPGEGYRIHVSRRDTLVLAEGLGSDGGGGESPEADVTRVSSIADALALTGLRVGDVVEVAGYTMPGDGGGGRFEVVDTGDAPDGGTVFVPTEHTAPTSAAGLEGNQTLFNGDGDGIAFESLRLFYGPGEEDYLPAVTLHGHGADVGGHPIFDPTQSRLRLPWSIRQYANALTGSDDMRVVYRYATGPVRLKRVVTPIRLEGTLTANYVRPEWWGARPYPEGWQPDTTPPPSPGAAPSGILFRDPVYDATDEVASALNAAHARSTQTGQDHYVVLSGMYGYSNVIEIPEGAILKGEADDVRDGQGLRVMKGGPWHYWATKTQYTDPAYRVPNRPRDHLQKNSHILIAVRHGRRANLTRVVDVEIDGNIPENDYLMTRDYEAASGQKPGSIWRNLVEEYLQNSTHWNGYVTTTLRTDTRPGSNARLENVHIHDFGGNLIVSQAATHVGGSRDLKLGNTAHNHALYGVETGTDPETGWIEGTTEIYGYFWEGGIEMTQGRFRKVVFSNLERNPYYGILGHLVTHRNRAPRPSDFGNPDQDVHYFGEDVVFDTMVLDLDEGLPITAVLTYKSGPFVVNNMDITQRGDDPLRITGYFTAEVYAPSSNMTVRNVRVRDGRVHGFIAGFPVQSHVRGVEAVAPGATDGSLGVTYVRVRDDVRYVSTIYDVGTDEPFVAEEPVKLDLPSRFRSNQSVEVYVQRSSFTGVSTPVMIKGRDLDDAEAQERVAVYWRDVKMNRWVAATNDGGTLRNSYKIQYFDNVRVGSRRSAADGSHTHPASASRDHIDLTPGLFFTPYRQNLVEITNVRVNGSPEPGLLTGRWTDVGTSRYQAPDGTTYNPVLRLELARPLRAGEEVTFDWSAAVNPFPAGVSFPE